MNRIGIRHEDKYTLERRTPLIPSDVRELTKDGIEIHIESSDKRIFRDDEFSNAGAAVADNMAECDVVLGVKEMPENYFAKDRTYIFFSHVIKGQPYNMPMLRNLMSAGSTLIDYEKIEDENGRRLIFFGRYAGLAGMVNTLWAAGKRFEELGIEHAFSRLKQAYRYNALDEAKSDIKEAAKHLHNIGLPEGMNPLIIAITGDGNVSQGALEIAELLQGNSMTTEELRSGKHFDTNPIQIVNITPGDYLTHIDGKEFDLADYIANPECYRSSIEELLPHIDIFVNGIYWDERYPKLIKKEWLKKQAQSGELKLRVIGDITCDVHGSVECTEKATEIEDPVFVYNPSDDRFKMGFRGDGIAVMAVDILPSELPREASEHFSSALKPYIKALANADFLQEFSKLHLPAPLKKAVIVHRGELTPEYKYIEEFL
ncbi:MAG: hypothetical protein EA391_02970 [Balneolaceae bacterium]|nr:MAG: hypothetical protein EA391_02970 [Balneolaceae bacterium]